MGASAMPPPRRMAMLLSCHSSGVVEDMQDFKKGFW